MKPLANETDISPTPSHCAASILEVIPLVMLTIRAEMRRYRRQDLTVPQFRVLAFLEHHQGSSLSDVAEHTGLTLPSISKLVDGLVQRKLIQREISPDDRRRVFLTLTRDGGHLLEFARRLTQIRLAEVLQPLTPAEQTTVMQAMQILQRIFA